jgi:hypothetical protein
MPTHADRMANVAVLQSIRLHFESAWAADGVKVLEAGSRGKGTNLGCSDLDVVVHVIREDSSSSEEEFVKGKLQRACESLRAADDLVFSNDGRPRIGTRSIKLSLIRDSRKVVCDVLIGVLGRDGNYLPRASLQTELSSRNAFWLSPSFSHLQKQYFKRSVIPSSDPCAAWPKCGSAKEPMPISSALICWSWLC